MKCWLYPSNPPLYFQKWSTEIVTFSVALRNVQYFCILSCTTLSCKALTPQEVTEEKRLSSLSALSKCDTVPILALLGFPRNWKSVRESAVHPQDPPDHPEIGPHCHALPLCFPQPVSEETLSCDICCSSQELEQFSVEVHLFDIY